MCSDLPVLGCSAGAGLPQMWPVVDASGNWIGWLGKATFLLTGTNTVSYDNFLAHLDWSSSTSGGVKTGSTYDSGIMCLDCNGKWQADRC
jgi:hypothetical protein